MLFMILQFWGVLILVVLFGVAIFLHWKLYKAKQRAQVLAVEHERVINKKREEAINSLRIIAKSYLSEQVELAEAGIRISRLMDFLALNEVERMPFRVFDEINKKLAHIPILKDWKDLDKNQRRQHQKTIADVEQEYEDFAKSAATQLADYKKPAVASFYAV